MDNQVISGNQPGELSERARMEQAMDALENLPPERAISAMPVVVPYTAVIGWVQHNKRGDEHHFRITRESKDGTLGEEWEEKALNAHAVRDEFMRVKEWSAAYDFLSSTGRFSPLDDTITWSEFQRWQDFARLVLEHSRLASAMQEGVWTGEHAEALKALTGIYPSSFFKSEPIPEQENEQLHREMLRHPAIRSQIKKGEQIHEQRRRALLAWFRRPPGEACSIEWFPKEKKDTDAILPKLQRGGAMIEFLLSRNALRPALVIHPSTTLHAIAASIFADYCNGVEYRTCEFCTRLFPVGKQKTKRFCNQAKCKNAAHSRRVRDKEREQLTQGSRNYWGPKNKQPSKPKKGR